MTIDENYRIIKIFPNPHLDSEIAQATHAGFLWLYAVPRTNVGGFDSSPYPLYLVFSRNSLTAEEASRVYDSWVAQHGS